MIHTTFDLTSWMVHSELTGSPFRGCPLFLRFSPFPHTMHTTIFRPFITLMGTLDQLDRGHTARDDSTKMTLGQRYLESLVVVQGGGET